MKITDELLEGYENTKYYDYKDLKEDFENSIYYDELPNHEVVGVLKANRYVNGRLLQTYSTCENHVGVIAATRQGKTTSYVIPTIISFAKAKNKRSMIITDPKGEVYDRTAETLRQMGYDVLLLNFRDCSHSECWNPLTPIFRKYKSVDKVREQIETVETETGTKRKFKDKIYDNKEELEAAIETYKESLMIDVGNDIDNMALMVAPTVKTNDPFWDEASRELIKAFLWGMLEDSDPKNIEGSDDRYLITEDTFSFATLINISACINKEQEGIPSFFSKRSSSSTARQIASLTIPASSRVTRSSLSATFSAKLNMFKETAIRLITSCNSFELKDKLLGDKPLALFINFRDELKVHFQMISLFVQDAYRILIEQATSCPDGKRPIPFYFILDEFGNCPKMNDFDTTISACAGRNIFFILIIQSYAQLTNVYGENTSGIIRDNLNMHVFFGSNNPDTLEDFSRECGQVTRLSPVSALNGDESEINQYHLETIHLIPVSKLRKFVPGECIITEVNCGYVLFSRLERYYMCKEFENLPRSNASKYVGRVNPFDARYRYGAKRNDEDEDIEEATEYIRRRIQDIRNIKF